MYLKDVTISYISTTLRTWNYLFLKDNKYKTIFKTLLEWSKLKQDNLKQYTVILNNLQGKNLI